ncbi:MAG: succinylglutamate desuccinylase/aspartoacylase family protein [Flavobacteriaceae bacterium]|nr:succinylglutamate desuccinylase/aspartoacylase family protein [Flavobacteriaceae bacterium]
MVEVHSKALDKSIHVNRVIGHIKGELTGPILIFTGGVHGNEPSGVFALQKVMDFLQSNEIPVKGSIYAISGNLKALEKGERYLKEDLNRLWTSKRMNVLNGNNPSKKNEDEVEQTEISAVINDIVSKEEGPFYFMDLHTTSGETIPFLTVNDSLLNRKFTMQYPVPLILGIEEFLEGPLLSYINELGYVAFGFEGGQHDDLASIENHEAFIYLSLVFSESIKKESVNFLHYYEVLAKTSIDSRGIFEIFYHYKIKDDESFKMNPGFLNFQRIKSGQNLAISDEKNINTQKKGRILMPQYQKQGDDGFFIIRSIPLFYLRLSEFFRNKRIDRILPLLPGVNWQSEKRDALIVNRKIAWVFAKQFFHLLGYRSKKIDKTHLIIKNREAASKKEDYYSSNWYNN